MEPSALLPTASPPALVVQHNALINARFNLTELESRLFLALMLRIERGDTAFAPCRIYIMELSLEKKSSGSMYSRVKQMIKGLSTRSILVNAARGPRSFRQTMPDYKAIPLLAYAEYLGGTGQIEARFNDLLVPYLLELCANFTKAELYQLLKLRSAVAHRIYWLLSEYAFFGSRTFALSELREILGVGSAEAPAYDRWDNFRTRILDKAQRELAATDLPFTYQALKRHRNGAVEQIRFAFPRRLAVAGRALGASSAAHLGEAPADSAPLADESSPVEPGRNDLPDDSWQTLLIDHGLSPKSVREFEKRVAAQHLAVGYIRFVVATVQQQAQAGKVQIVGGAIYKALVEGYLQPAYAQSVTPVAKTLRKPGPTLQRQKLEQRAADLRNSHQTMQTMPLAAGQDRAQLLRNIERDVAAVQQQLTQLSE